MEQSKRKEQKIMKWTDVSEPASFGGSSSRAGYKPNRYRNPYIHNTNMYSDDPGFVEFMCSLEGYKDLSVTAPVKICIRIWHPPVRLKAIRFFSGEPIVCKVFRNFKTIKGAF